MHRDREELAHLLFFLLLLEVRERCAKDLRAGGEVQMSRGERQDRRLPGRLRNQWQTAANDKSVAIQRHLNRLGMRGGGHDAAREVDGRATFDSGAQVGARVDEHLHGRVVAIVCGPEEGAPAVPGARVDCRVQAHL